jgi:hypothetical protein
LSKERCIIRIVAWVFRGGLLSHMACENYSQAMPSEMAVARKGSYQEKTQRTGIMMATELPGPKRGIVDRSALLYFASYILQGVELPGDIDFLFYSRNPLFFRGDCCESGLDLLKTVMIACVSE